MWRRSRSTNIYFILDSWREKENFMLNIHTIYVTFPLVSAMKKTKCSRESHPSGSDLFLIMPGPLGWKWCRPRSTNTELMLFKDCAFVEQEESRARDKFTETILPRRSWCIQTYAPFYGWKRIYSTLEFHITW